MQLLLLPNVRVLRSFRMGMKMYVVLCMKTYVCMHACLSFHRILLSLQFKLQFLFHDDSIFTSPPLVCVVLIT